MPARWDQMVDVMSRKRRSRLHDRIATLPLTFAVKFIVEDLDPDAARRLDMRLKPLDGRAALDLGAIRSLYAAADFPRPQG